jgi:triacylglycerol lipase
MNDRDLYNLTTNFDGYRKQMGIEYQNILRDNLTGARCIVGKQQTAEHRVSYFFCFQGTELKFNDIVTDILFSKSVVPYENTNPEIKVHLGFLTQYMSIREKILRHIGYFFFCADSLDALTFIFTGHSLGAALATLAILDFQYNFSRKQELLFSFSGVGFGSPRVGNVAFRDSFNSRVESF